MREVISNTSPLQYLHQLRLLALLPEFYQSILVPPAVSEEIAHGRRSGIDLPDLALLPWLRVRTPQNAVSPGILSELGPGESEAIALARESPGALLILDDRAGRRHAHQLKMTLTGTLGILIKAKQAGRMPKIRPILDELERLHFRVSTKVRDIVLRVAGET